jgi:hypothetical protein
VVLELGKPGSAGAETGEWPVLRGGTVVGVLRASNWKEAATAVVAGDEWLFAKTRGELTGRRATDPEGSVRLRARQTSFWRGSWTVDLAGTAVDVETASVWKGTHRYVSGGRPLGESAYVRGWSPRPRVILDPALPLEQQVFLLWLELVISRRSADGSGGIFGGDAGDGGGGGGGD